MDKDEETLSDREWREKLKDAHELFDMFKRAAYKDHEL